MERAGAKFEEVRPLVVGARGREGLENGDINHGVWSAGMIQGLIHDIPSVQELVTRIVADAEAIITKRMAGFVVK